MCVWSKCVGQLRGLSDDFKKTNYQYLWLRVSKCVGFSFANDEGSLDPHIWLNTKTKNHVTRMGETRV